MYFAGHSLRLVIAGLFCLCLCAAPRAAAQDMPKRVVVRKDVPSLKKIHHVAAKDTHSGYPVPRYVSLKYGQVNGRRGPSTQHPILWQYRRRGLPLIVVAEMDIWRKVRDINGDESWVRSSALSGAHTVIVTADTTLKTKPESKSRSVAVASKDTLLTLEECRPDGWCKVKSEDNYKGWVREQNLWGAKPF